MGRLERRLDNLEGRGAKTREAEEERVSGEALTRVTTEDLRLVHAYLGRAVKGYTEPTEEEGGALRRYKEIKDDVRRKHAAR